MVVKHKKKASAALEGYLQAWKGKAKVGIDRWVAHTGKRSVKIAGTESGWESIGVAIKDNASIKLLPGKRYRLSAWVKSKDVEDFANGRPADDDQALVLGIVQ